jgi:hypothetical protein
MGSTKGAYNPALPPATSPQRPLLLPAPQRKRDPAQTTSRLLPQPPSRTDLRPARRPVRLVAQDARLSRGQQGFESPTGHHLRTKLRIPGPARPPVATCCSRAVFRPTIGLSSSPTSTHSISAESYAFRNCTSPAVRRNRISSVTALSLASSICVTLSLPALARSSAARQDARSSFSRSTGFSAVLRQPALASSAEN